MGTSRLEGLLPASLFARLALLLVATVLISHILVLSLLFDRWKGGPGAGPPPPPPAATAPQADRHGGPPPGQFSGMALDIGLRLAALLLAAWVGARWLADPLRRMAKGAAALGQDVHRAPLVEEGTIECREAIRVINQLQRNIQSQMAQRDRFLAAVSHDLRTPLTRLALRTEYLPDAQTRADFAKDIAEMNAMIGATLDYLRGASAQEPTRQTDLTALIESLVGDLQETGLAVELAADLPAQWIAPVQPASLRRCLSNLIENAVRYGQRARVGVNVEHDGHHSATLWVEDDGPGLPEAQLLRVLEPFYRVEASRNRHSGGVGLGLTIAKEIAERHGATLTLSNRPEGGLRAEILLLFK